MKLQRPLGVFIVPHFQLISSTCSCYFLPCCTSKLFSVGHYNLLRPHLWSPFLRLILATVLTLVVLQYYFALPTFLLRALKLLLMVNTLIVKPFNQEFLPPDSTFLSKLTSSRKLDCGRLTECHVHYIL